MKIPLATRWIVIITQNATFTVPYNIQCHLFVFQLNWPVVVKGQTARNEAWINF